MDNEEIIENVADKLMKGECMEKLIAKLDKEGFDGTRQRYVFPAKEKGYDTANADIAGVIYVKVGVEVPEKITIEF